MQFEGTSSQPSLCVYLLLMQLSQGMVSMWVSTVLNPQQNKSKSKSLIHLNTTLHYNCHSYACGFEFTFNSNESVKLEPTFNQSLLGLQNWTGNRPQEVPVVTTFSWLYFISVVHLQTKIYMYMQYYSFVIAEQSSESMYQ